LELCCYGEKPRRWIFSYWRNRNRNRTFLFQRPLH